MLNKVIYHILLMISFPCAVYAQKEWKAQSAPRGIFVVNNHGAASVLHPAPDGTTAVAVYRARAGSSDWRKLAELQVPPSLYELKKLRNRFLPNAPDLQFVDEADVVRVWGLYEKGRYTFDSCYQYLNEPSLAMAMGRYYYDTTAEKNVAYVYQLRKVKNGTESAGQNTVEASWPQKPVFLKPEFVSSKGFEDKITCMFRMPLSAGERKPKFFRVFRADVLGSFYPVPADAYISIRPAKDPRKQKDSMYFEFYDNMVSSGKNYRYFIAAGDAYGNLGYGSDTIGVSSYAAKDIAIPYNFRTVANPAKETIELHWTIENAAKAGSVEVYRSDRFSGDYSLLGKVSPEDTVYSDAAVRPAATYYYYIRVIDRNGMKSLNSIRAYGRTTSKRRPDAVADLRATASKTGVELQFTRPSDEMIGFYVYRGIGLADTLHQISQLIYTSDSLVKFADTHGLYHPSGYSYAVMTENSSHLSGELSNRVFVSSGATGGTMLSVVSLNAVSTGKSVLLLWTDMSGYQHGFTGYEIQRKENQGEWKNLTEPGFGRFTNMYEDTAVRKGNTYTYRVSVLGAGGARSAAAAETSVSLEDSDMPTVDALAAFYHRDTLTLSWDYTDEYAFMGFEIWQGTDEANSQMKKTGQVGPDAREYHLLRPEKGKRLLLTVKPVGLDGKATEENYVLSFRVRE